MKMQIGRCLVRKLKAPEQSGDWHDKPLKWEVYGPAGESQKFQTKVGAMLYAGLRNAAKDQPSAIDAFVNRSEKHCNGHHTGFCGSSICPKCGRCQSGCEKEGCLSECDDEASLLTKPRKVL